MTGKELSPGKIKKVLIIKTSSLGDIIHVLPCLKAIRELFPSAKISWLVQKEYSGLLESSPYIDKCIAIEKLSGGNLSAIFGVVSKLRKEKFDLVIDFQWLIRTGVIAYLTGAPLRFGLKNWKEPSYLFYNRKIFVDHKNIHAVERNILFAKAVGAEINKVDFPLFINEASRDRIKKLTGGISEYVVIAPAARWESKRWPAESFASLIEKIPVLCVITGGKGDRETAREIMHRAQSTEHRTRKNSEHKTQNSKLKTDIIDLCGKTDLNELIALIAGAKAVVSNDSGPMHIAAALNKPVIALFGPTDPVRTGPYGWQGNKNLKVITSGVSCSPCFKKECGDLICMKNIGVETVYEALREYL